MKLGNRILLFICILSFSCGFAFAAESSIKIKATVDKNEVAQDEYINYRVVISSTISLDNPKIKLPDLNKEFFILSSSKAQNMSLLAGKTLVEIVLDYVLQPKKSGDIKIEEVEVRYRGKIYKSEPQTIKVKESKESLPKREIPFEDQTEDSLNGEKVTL